MGITVKNIRNSNLELYRIIVMFLIVMHHYVVNSDLMTMICDNPMSLKSVYLFITGMWGKTGINCFVLITGYFMCKSRITLRKFLKLILEVEFYEIVIFVILAITGVTDFTLTRFIWYSLPIRSISSGSFTDGYLFFFLFIPFLNALIDNLSKKIHLYLIVLLLFFFSIVAKVPNIQVNQNYVSWFCIIYVIGAYLRKYPLHEDNQRFWGGLLLITIFLSIISVVGIVAVLTFLHRPCERGLVYYFVEDSNALFTVITSVCLFMFFKGLKVKQSKFINIVGGTFGILLIHDNLLVRPWLWDEFLDNGSWYASNAIYLQAIFVPFFVIIICAFIEFFRGRFLEKPIIDFFIIQ